MPTMLPRSQITHTPNVRHPLEVASKQWPGQTPGALLVHLIEEGARSIESRDEIAKQDRRARVLALSEKYAGTYEPGYLESLREGWTE